MKIIVDAFGGDNAPLEIIKGCRMAADEYGVSILLVGDEGQIKRAAQGAGISLDGLETAHAEGVIPMEAEPTSLLKQYKGCSMEHAFQLLARGEGDAVVSAGSTGAILAGGTFIVKRIKGIKRACIATVLPLGETGVLLLDSGANSECRPEMLCQFGIMGSVYMQAIMGVERPRVGLINIGSEESKGTELQIQAYGLLKAAPIRFTGNLEARELPLGGCDVAVADGFTGNVSLKLIEGMAKYFSGEFKKILMRNGLTKVCALPMKGGIAAFKKKLDASEHGGAPLLGLKKPVIKAHGNSDAKAVKNAVRQAIGCCKNNMVGRIEECLAQVKTEEA